MCVIEFAEKWLNDEIRQHELGLDNVDAESAGLVQVVRCGECKHYDPLDKSRPFFCPIMNCEDGVMEDDYCSRGERKGEKYNEQTESI